MKITNKIITVVILFATFSIVQADEKNYRNDHPKWQQKDKITKAEYLKWHEELFNKMDTNKDGVLTIEERKAFREAHKQKMEEKSKKN